MTLPNALSLVRVGLGVAIFGVMLTGERVVPLVFLVLGIATDIADGALARRTGATSTLGAFLDPLADKVLVFGALLPLAASPRVGVPLAILLARDAAVTWLRRGRPFPPSALSRLKTAVLDAACVVYLVAAAGGEVPREPADILLASGAALAVLSAAKYATLRRAHA